MEPEVKLECSRLWFRSLTGRPVQAVVYRESYTGRIAAIYHNDERMFGASTFTLIPKYEYCLSLEKHDLTKVHEVYRSTCGGERQANTRSNASDTFLPYMKVALTLDSLTHFTVLQSEDPGWFLARTFQFTSRTTQGFFTIFASDYDMHVKALAHMLCVKQIMMGADALSSDHHTAEIVLRDKWNTILSAFNMQKRTRSDQSTSAASVSQVLQCTLESLSAQRKEDLLALLVNVGHRQPTLSRKQKLISKILQLQRDVADGTVQLQNEQPQTVSEDEQRGEYKQKLTARLYEASIGACFMKPLVSTAGMKEGSFNEHKILEAVPNFFQTHNMTTANEIHRTPSPHSIDTVQFRVEYICTVGLIGSKSVQLMAGSPDGVEAISNNDGDVHVAAVEIKTMTSLSTIESARHVRSLYNDLVYIPQIGNSEHSMIVFHDMVPTTAYRIQCMYHSAVLEKQWVLLVVGKGSSMGVGEIIYSVLLEFTDILTATYAYCLTAVRKSCFEWISQDAKKIPTVYDNILVNTHAADLFSFASFYNLSRAYKRLAVSDGPLPPARMIRPSGLVFWNLLKGGVDEFSRALKSLCYTNSSENPVVSFIGRLLCAQINNAAIVHRSSIAKAKGLLPDIEKYKVGNNTGYRRVRHDVTSCGSFSAFARLLAREYTEILKQCSVSHSALLTTATTTQAHEVMKPMYTKDAVTKYNRTADAERRLSNLNAHKKTKGKPAYCSLCSFNFTLRLQGKVFKKKGGSRMRQWCNICRQPICSECWEKWHHNRQLSRATISPAQLELLKRKAEASLTHE